MSKITRYELVVINSPHGAFVAGSTVEGHVALDLAEPMRMKCLKIFFSGMSKVHWYIRGGDNRDTKHYRASENYFQHHVILFGSGDQPDQPSMHPAGQYTYPFSFLLPSGLPSSFEGKHGHIRYLTEVSIVKTWKNITIVRPLSVLSTGMDLNNEPHLQSPAVARISKNVTLLCCISGDVTAEVTIDKKGFVPGEFIHILANVQNDSNTTAWTSRASLIQHVTFYGKSDSLLSSGNLKPKSTSSVVVSCEKGQILAGTTCIWDDVLLKIPALPPSRLQGCQIMDVSYSFKFEVVIDWSRIEINSEIVLGTVPFRPIVTQQPRATLTVPPPDTLVVDSIIVGDSPPTYEQCVLNNGPVQFTDENDSGQAATTVF